MLAQYDKVWLTWTKLRVKFKFMKCGCLSVIEDDGCITVTITITTVEDFCLVWNFYANEKYN